MNLVPSNFPTFTVFGISESFDENWMTHIPSYPICRIYTMKCLILIHLRLIECNAFRSPFYTIYFTLLMMQNSWLIICIG